MSKKATILLFFLVLSTLTAFAQSKLIIRDLKGLEWKYDKRYSLLDSSEYLAYSFSVANVIDSNMGFPILDKCSCIMDGDTVNIWIHNKLAEGGFAVSILLTKNFWKSFIQQYSDVEEFDSGYYQNYVPEKSTLIVNLPNYKMGDVLKGSIDITVLKIAPLDSHKLTFNGAFQCVIMEK